MWWGQWWGWLEVPLWHESKLQQEAVQSSLGQWEHSSSSPSGYPVSLPGEVGEVLLGVSWEFLHCSEANTLMPGSLPRASGESGRPGFTLMLSIGRTRMLPMELLLLGRTLIPSS